MLILVSDLHLADSAVRSSFDSDSFQRELTVQVDACPEGDRVKLVLLGDVFELLKTPRWLQSELRPWHDHGEELERFVATVADEIVRTNQAFFEGIRALARTHQMEVELVPGNHDGLLSNDSGRLARAVFRQALGIAGGDAALLNKLTDEAHGIWAQHGHEFDSFNSFLPQRPRFVPGDVVVIELVAALPTVVAEKLGCSEDDPRVRFLHELDNVLPQDGKGLTAWLKFSVARIAEPERSKVLSALKEALVQCLGNARKQARQYGELTSALSALFKAMEQFVGSGGLSAVGQIAKLQPMVGSELSAVHGRAMTIGQSQLRGPQETFLFVSGHTHYPMHEPLPVAGDRVITYLNSGTWRRVYRCVDQESGARRFSTYVEESMLVVHRREGTHPPAYGFRRQVRGV